MYTGPHSHYMERTINKREPEWLYDRAKLREEHFRPEDSVKEKDGLGKETRELRVFAKEFGQGVRKRQDERKGTNSPSGPKNNPKSSKMKMLLTCSKRSKPLDPGQLEQFRLKLCSSFCRGRCSCLKTQLKALFGVLYPRYFSGEPSS